MHDLAAAVPALAGDERREANALLARPTDGADDPIRDGYPAGRQDRERREPALLRLLGRRRRVPGRTRSHRRERGRRRRRDARLRRVAARDRRVLARDRGGAGAARLEAPEARQGGLRRRSGRARRHLPEAARQEGAVRIPDGRPGPGPDAQPVRLHGARQRLRQGGVRLRRPERPGEGHLRPRVQPPAADRTTTSSRTRGCSSRPRPGSRRRSTRRSTTTSATCPPSRSYPSEPITELFPPQDKKALRIYGAATWNHWLDTGGGGYGAETYPARLGGLRRDRARGLRASRL